MVNQLVTKNNFNKNSNNDIIVEAEKFLVANLDYIMAHRPLVFQQSQLIIFLIIKRSIPNPVLPNTGSLLQ